MKKLLVLSAVLLGSLAATQAGVDIRINVGLPIGIISRPAPVIVAPAPCHVPPPCPPPHYSHAPRHHVVVAPAPIVVIKHHKKHHHHHKDCAYCAPRVVHGHYVGHGHGHRPHHR